MASCLHGCSVDALRVCCGISHSCGLGGNCRCLLSCIKSVAFLPDPRRSAIQPLLFDHAVITGPTVAHPVGQKERGEQIQKTGKGKH